MKKLITAALGLAVAGLPVLAAPALAQDRDCNQAQREVTRVELRLAELVTAEREAEQAALRTAQDALEAAQTALRDAGPGVDLAPLRAAVDTAREARDAAREALNTDSRRLADLRVELRRVIETRDEACDDDPAPTTSPAPTTTAPAPTTSAPAPTTRVVVPDVNIDNNIDVVIPRGGVNTGGGPA